MNKKLLISIASLLLIVIICSFNNFYQDYDSQFIRKHNLKQNQAKQPESKSKTSTIHNKKQKQKDKKSKDKNPETSKKQNQKNKIPLYEDIIKDIKKPKLDQNEYEIFTTSNGIRTLLVTSPEVQNYGASLTIKGVGSYQDPQDAQGLSHFTEHLLFTGSKNYPKWDMVSDITLKGGIFNGLTMSNTTQYPIGYNNEQILEETLKKIVDFIINPGLKKDVLEREIYAVTSEYHLDIVDSSSKVYYLWKLLANPSSDFYKFDIGDVESLKKAIQNPQIIRDYITRTYVPENMFLVIQTSKDLQDKSRDKIEKIFSKIPERKAPPKYKIPPVFNEKSKGIFTKLKDTSKIQELTLAFNTQVFDSYNSKSLDYVQTMLQTSDNKNDFCTYIQQKFWAADCTIDNSQINRLETVQSVTITLTQAGQYKISEIIQYFFKSVESVRDTGIQQQIYNVIKNEYDYAFNLQQQSDIFTSLTDLGLEFSWNPNKNVLYQPYNYANFNRTEIELILDQFTLDNAIFTYRSNDFLEGQFKGSQDIDDFIFNQDSFITSDLWDFQYQVYRFTESDVELLENQQPANITFDNSRVNSLNLFNASLISKHIKKNNRTTPNLLKSDQNGNLWFYEDISFKLPYTAFVMLLDHENGINTAKENFYSQLAVEIINSELSEPSVSATPRGLQFTWFLPSNLVALMAQTSIQQFKSIKLQQNEKLDYILETLKIGYVQSLENYNAGEGIQYLQKILRNNTYVLRDYQLELSQFDFQDFEKWFQSYQQNSHIEVLITGNTKKNIAISLYNAAIQNLNFSPIKNIGKNQAIRKLENMNILRRFSQEYDHYNQCVINIYRLPQNIGKDKVYILNYFNLYFEAYSFKFLRSIHQLGYIAQASIQEINGVQHLLVFIEGYRKDVMDMDQRIEELFDYVYQRIKESDDGDQINLKNYVFNPPKNAPEFLGLVDETSQFWFQILSEEYFLPDKKVNKIKTISKSDILQLYTEWFKDGKNKLSIQLVNPYVHKQLPHQKDIKTYNQQKNIEVYNTPNQLLEDNNFEFIKSDLNPVYNILN